MPIYKSKLDRENLAAYFNTWVGLLVSEEMGWQMADAAIDAYGGTPQEIARRVGTAEQMLHELVVNTREIQENRDAVKEVVREVMAEEAAAKKRR